MLIFFDDHRLPRLYPLTLTRPAADLRIGILTIKEKWEKRLGASASSFLTVGYLREKFALATESENLLINGRFLPKSGSPFRGSPLNDHAAGAQFGSSGQRQLH